MSHTNQKNKATVPMYNRRIPPGDGTFTAKRKSPEKTHSPKPAPGGRSPGATKMLSPKGLAVPLAWMARVSNIRGRGQGSITP